jgi:hypothetical protein
MRSGVRSMCSILLGVFSGIAGLVYFLLPEQQRLGTPGDVILPSFARDPMLLNIENLVLGIIGILGLAVVPAVAQRLGLNNSDWRRWVHHLALVGFAVSAVGSFIILARLPVIAAAYERGDGATRVAVAAVWRTTLDPVGLWGFGAIGLWILVVSLFMLRRPGLAYPAGLGYLGIVAAAAHWLVPIAFVTRTPFLFFLVAGGGGIVVAMWYIWLGVVLGGESDQPA